MNSAADKVTLTCPQCRQELTVSATAIGKHGRCPSCQHVFPLESSLVATVVEPLPPYSGPFESKEDYALQPLPPAPPTSDAIPNPYGPEATHSDAGKYGHGFGWEHRGWDSGMTGGLAMMAIGAIWFFGGLAFGIIFYYPLILFIIGLVGFFRGIFTGNVSGRKAR